MPRLIPLCQSGEGVKPLGGFESRPLRSRQCPTRENPWLARGFLFNRTDCFTLPAAQLLFSLFQLDTRETEVSKLVGVSIRIVYILNTIPGLRVRIAELSAMVIDT
jgi:hypothetical protein